MLLGIPRALHTYNHYPLWQGLLAGLGVGTVLSPASTREILDAGVRAAPSEICLPVKAYFGHVAWLSRRCDAVLVPRVVCLKQDSRLRFGCPKALALPDLIRSVVSPLPRVIELNLDERLEPARKSYLNLARLLTSDHRGGSEFERALQRQCEMDATLRSGAPFESFWNTAHSSFDTRHSSLPSPRPAPPAPQPPIPALRIGIVAHSYLLYDPSLSIGLLDRLVGMGVEPVVPQTTPETADFPEPSRAREICWFYEQELLRAASYMLSAGRVDGLLLVSSFSCGTSAVINEVINRELNHAGTPMSTLLLDEHTAEAGLTTRLEAFVDLVRHRARASSKVKGQSPNQRVKSQCQS